MNITLNKNYRFILMPRAMLTSFLPDLANNKYSECPMSRGQTKIPSVSVSCGGCIKLP